MKKTIFTTFCITVVFSVFQLSAFANDFKSKAISAFQEFRKANDEWSAVFMSGDSDTRKEKGEQLTVCKDNFTRILRSLPGEYCADPDVDVLREFIKTLISITDEYPTYVFAEMYACDPDTVTKEIMSLSSEDQKKIVENLDWGFKNVSYKLKSYPNYKELTEKLDKLKSMTRHPKSHS